MYIQTSQFKNDTIEFIDHHLLALKSFFMETLRHILNDNIKQLSLYLPQLEKKPIELLDYPKYME